MPRRSSSIDTTVDARQARLLPVIEDVIARRLSGEDLSDEAILAAHPELMPDLNELLSELRNVEAARGRATGSSGILNLQKLGGRAADRAVAPQPFPVALPGYDLGEEIHRGGQGVVYRAVQKFTHREVAIKVLREGPFSGESERSRFQREVEILASLNHPDIVTIHESGIVDGRHYFVMDYVAGSALDTFMDHLPVSSRTGITRVLQLFISMCQAVNAAHLRGVIHRDLKPSNIRVDRSGRPRVLDFGLAKLSDGVSGRPSSDVTIAGQFIGSLPWCSPEQAEGRPDKIDMRSDVYSLGVVLYRGVTGRLPHDITGTTREILDRILRESPVSPRRYNPAVDDELETIILKCIAKEPERRYQTAGHLAGDLEHYLRGEAIEAKRDSGWYVLRKTLRRYRVQTAVAAGFVLLVAASAVALGVLYGREKSALNKANVETRKAEITTDFLQDMLAAADPNTAQGRELTVRELLDAASARAATELNQDPQVAITIHSTIGQTYLSLGLAEQAEREYRAALDRSALALPTHHPDVLVAENGLATALEDQSRYDEAETLFRKCLDSTRASQGAEHPFTIDVLHNLANLLRKRGKSGEAQMFLQEALERSRRVFGEEDPATLTTRKILAAISQDMGNFDAAETEFRDILAIQRRTLGDRAPLTIGTMNYLAMLLKARGKLDEATPFYEELLRLTREVLGPDHPDTLRNLNSYGRLLHDQGKLTEAETVFREALDGLTRKLGENHFDTLVTTNNLSLLLSEQGRFAEAEPLAQSVLRRGRALLGDEHPSVLVWMNNLANLYARKGDPQAEALYRQVLEVRRRVLGAEHAQTLTTLSSLANLYVEEPGARRLDEAESTQRQVLEIRRRIFGEAHPDTLLSMNNLLKVLLARGPGPALEEASILANHALETAREALGPAHPLSLLIANNAGATFAARDQLPEALSLLTDALALAEEKLPAGHIVGTSLRATLGRTLLQAMKLDEAERHLKIALEVSERTLGPSHATTRRIADDLNKIPASMPSSETADPAGP
ncbi:MAG TPA: tetratricopeptide repeat protein [Phycisphaerae bacterium]|nr:tetratricopeptide repeat protein [Phycisphaerae bacterium]